MATNRIATSIKIHCPMILYFSAITITSHIFLQRKLILLWINNTVGKQQLNWLPSQYTLILYENWVWFIETSHEILISQIEAAMTNNYIGFHTAIEYGDSILQWIHNGWVEYVWLAICLQTHIICPRKCLVDFNDIWYIIPL